MPRFDHGNLNWIELDPDGAVNKMVSMLFLFGAGVCLWFLFR